MHRPTLLPAWLLLCCAAQVFDGPPATVAELAAVEEDLTAGAMQADVVATNQLPLDLQLLQASQPLGPELLSSLFCCAFCPFTLVVAGAVWGWSWGRGAHDSVWSVMVLCAQAGGS